MARKWNKGTNCVLKQDFNGYLTGDKSWVFEVTDTAVVLLTKTKDVVAPERAEQKITVPLEQAEAVIQPTTGKPRKDFSKFAV